jgi:hypothetical protein
VARPDMREHMAREAGIPGPKVAGALNAPVARYFARKAGATEERARATVAMVPALIDHTEKLIDDGVIGGGERNAADFQIAPSIRVLMTFEDLAPMFEGRSAAEFATEILPDYPTMVPAGMIPAEWIQAAPVTASSRS